jgi:4-coumarate--CoA ligase (photoactive yellow protein activation family)
VKVTESQGETDTAIWHRSHSSLARFVSDLVAGELKLLRSGGGHVPPLPWSSNMPVGEDGLGLDSLERMEVASALSEALHLHESGVEDLLLARRTFGEWVDIASRGLAHFDSQLSFRTSGSSGEPKGCRHAFADLAQEVDHLFNLFRGVKRIVSAVPAHHIYGFLFTVLLPEKMGGLEVIDVRLVPPRTLTRQLRAGDLVISHPTHWSLVARHGGSLPSGVTGVSSTAPCPAELAAELCRPEGGLKRLVQVYGSSETAGVGWRDSPDAPFQLMPHWSRAPGGQLELRRRSDNGATCTAMTQDVIDWLDERHFHVAGRLDAAVQVGGTNVFPKRISTLLSTHPQVRDAAVRLMTAAEGDRLKAFVVPEAGADTEELRKELDHWANKHLSAPERPKSYTFGSQLPVNENGKCRDWS